MFELIYTSHVLGPSQSRITVWCEQRLGIKDRTLTYNCLLLQIVTWMVSCLIATHNTSSYIYYMFCRKLSMATQYSKQMNNPA